MWWNSSVRLRVRAHDVRGSVKIGKSARITTASLKQFVESLPASPGGSPIKRADTRSLEDLGLK
jgi:hypothetical protein